MLPGVKKVQEVGRGGGVKNLFIFGKNGENLFIFSKKKVLTFFYRRKIWKS